MTTKYHVPFARLQEWNHPNPECTAFKPLKGMNFDYLCQVWTNRGAMLKACQMSDTGELGNNPFKPLVKS